MTDEHRSDDALTPAEEQRVRRLLAEARHTAPMPADVVDRLDLVLRELADERDETLVAVPTAAGEASPESATSDRTVVSLDAARRRRRRTSGLLVAAAAVLAIGVGVPAWISNLGTGSSDTSAGSAPAADSAGGAEPEMASGDAATTKGAHDNPTPLPDGSAYAAEAPEVAASRFRRDAIRLAGADAALTSGSAGNESRTKSLFDLAGCTRADDWGPGEGVAVVFEDAPALMIYRDPIGGLQQVDLYRCDSIEPTLTTQIPAP